MKNVATELCIILIGYFTLVPAIQVSHTHTHFLSRQEVCVLNSPSVFPGVLSVCGGGAGVRLLPADVLLHHRSLHRHPPHGGESRPVPRPSPTPRPHAPPTGTSLTVFPPSAGRPEPPSSSRGRAPPAQTGATASAGDPPAPAPLPPHHHSADAGLQDPQAPQEAARGLLPGPHAPGPAHHHGGCGPAPSRAVAAPPL